MQKKYKGFTLCKPKRYLTGFTIVELMVVITIIGILATLTTINVVGAKQRANYTKVLADMDTISDATRLYQEEYKTWPTSSVSGGVLLPADASFNTYMATWPTTPCKNYEYAWENILFEAIQPANHQGVVFAYHPFGDIGNLRYYFDVNDFANADIVTGQNTTPTSTTDPTPKYFQTISIKDVTSITCKE